MKEQLTGQKRTFFALWCFVYLCASGSQARADLLAGWDMHTQSNYGASPMVASSTVANEIVGGLTRGSGVTTTGTAAARAWGGNGWLAANEAAAITAQTFATFTLAPASGFALSFTSLSFDYRRSGTGASNGELQYSLDGTTFVDAAALVYSATTSSGGSISPINLSSFTDLQNVTSTVTFRIVNYGGTSAAGTWYIFDVGNSTANDLIVSGVSNPLTSDVSIGAGTVFSSTSFGGSAFTPANTAVFDGTGTTVNLSGTVVATGLNFTQPGYTLASPTANDAIVLSQVAVNTASATISGRITGTNPFVKAGGGLLVLSGSNDFVGNINIQAGTLQISSDANLGDVSNGITISGVLGTTASITLAPTRGLTGTGSIDIAAGTTLTTSGSVNMTSLTLSNTGTLNLQGSAPSLGNLAFTAAGTVVGNPVALTGLTASGLTSGTARVLSDILFSTGNKTVNIAAGGTLEIGNVTFGDGVSRIAKTGSGVLVLNGSNDGSVTFGSTTGDGGMIVLNNAGALGTSGQLFHNSGTLLSNLDLTGVNCLSIGTSIGGQTAAAVYTGSNIEFNGASDIFSSGTNKNHVIVNNTTILSGGFTISGTTTTGFIVGGTGTLVVYNAPAVITVGTLVTDSATLVVNSSWTGSSAAGSGITVDTGATIKGGGTIIGGLTVNGTLSPGNGPGLLTVDNLILGSTATTVMELGGTGTRGVDYDALDLTDITLDGVIKVVLSPTYDPLLGDTFDLFDWTGSVVDNTVVFDFSQAVLDTGLGWDTSSFASNGTISVVAIPEPSTVALLLTGGLGLLAWNRRRSATARRQITA